MPERPRPIHNLAERWKKYQTARQEAKKPIGTINLDDLRELEHQHSSGDIEDLNRKVKEEAEQRLKNQNVTHTDLTGVKPLLEKQDFIDLEATLSPLFPDDATIIPARIMAATAGEIMNTDQQASPEVLPVSQSESKVIIQKDKRKKDHGGFFSWESDELRILRKRREKKREKRAVRWKKMNDHADMVYSILTYKPMTPEGKPEPIFSIKKIRESLKRTKYNIKAESKAPQKRAERHPQHVNARREAPIQSMHELGEVPMTDTEFGQKLGERLRAFEVKSTELKESGLTWFDNDFAKNFYSSMVSWNAQGGDSVGLTGAETVQRTRIMDDLRNRGNAVHATGQLEEVSDEELKRMSDFLLKYFGENYNTFITGIQNGNLRDQFLDTFILGYQDAKELARVLITSQEHIQEAA